MKKHKQVKWKLVINKKSDQSAIKKLESPLQEYLDDSRFYDLDMLNPSSSRKVVINKTDTVKEGKLKRTVINLLILGAVYFTQAASVYTQYYL